MLPSLLGKLFCRSIAPETLRNRSKPERRRALRRCLQQVEQLEIRRVMDAPTITSNGGGDNADISVFENLTAVTTVTAVDPDVGQTLTFRISGGVDIRRFQMSGAVLTFIAAPNFEAPNDLEPDNVYEVTVEVNDGAGGTDSQNLRVRVVDVNEAPTFTPGSNVTVNEDSGPQAISSWATGISAGPESGQTLTFSIDAIAPPVTAAQTQWSGYAGGPQHQATSSVASQPLNAIRWQTPVDLNPQYSGSNLLIHYGSPLVTQANTVIVPVKTGTSGGFRIDARNGSDGSLLWSQTTDYVLPAHNWTPSYAPTLAIGNRIYYPGAGGTVFWRDAVDSASPTASGQIAFYGLANYDASRAAYQSSIQISTPLTADVAGNIYFGYRANGSNPLVIRDGFARIAPDGTAIYTSALTATSGSHGHTVTNAAPAVSLDGQSIYVAVSGAQGFGTGKLLKLNSATLATQSSVALKDVKSGLDAYLPDDGTASPMVGPDGDVYFGVLENPFASNHYRGWTLHFSNDLSQTKIPGAFGWDDTPSVVPSSMVPSYHGTSSYLLMTKYNNYAGANYPGTPNGDGVNKIAILDPNATMTDPISGATVMLEVLTIAGVTPDGSPPAVREWCINTAAVDPATKSILANSEDGKLYRWDLTTNTFSQVITLTVGIGEAYTPTLIGADGAVYAINNATLFSVGYSNSDLNSGLFSVLPSVNPLNGNLSFTPAANAFGTSKITLSLKDNGGIANGGIDTTTRTFTISVNSVNDAPTLNAISNPAAIQEDSGQQSVSLSGIGPGPANERSQLLTITAISSNPALIPNPVFTGNGSDTGLLKYTPVANTFGSSLITVTVKDNGGTTNSGVDTLTRTFTVTVIADDVTRPVSAVAALPANATSLSIPISVSGSDPVGPEGPATGVKEFDLYVAQDSGAFAKFATVPVATPNTVFTAVSNHTYFFRSVARDNKGNEEFEPANVPDAMIRVGDLDKPVTQVDSATADSLGRITLAMSGTDAGGSRLARFDLYVSIDSAVSTLVSSTSAGAANGSSVYSATTVYQGLTDNLSHSYRFFTLGVDNAGNVENAPLVGDVTRTQTFGVPASVVATGIDVQQGAKQRSYVNLVDVSFADAAALAGWYSAGTRVQIEKFAINAANVSAGTGTIISGYTPSLAGNKLKLDFGTNGLGGSKTTTAGDGFYRIRLDLNGNGQFDDVADQAYEFHRLLGDADGNGLVNVDGNGVFNTLDTNVVDSLMGRVGTNLDGDLDGSGAVNIIDKSYTARQRGRGLTATMRSLLDD